MNFEDFKQSQQLADIEDFMDNNAADCVEKSASKDAGGDGGDGENGEIAIEIDEVQRLWVEGWGRLLEDSLWGLANR